MAIVLANVDKIVNSNSKEFPIPEVDTPQEGDVLVYDATSQKWKNSPKTKVSTSRAKLYFASSLS